MSIHMSLHMSAHMPTHMSTHMSVHMSVHKPVPAHTSMRMSIYAHVCLCTYLYTCPHVCHAAVAEIDAYVPPDNGAAPL